ncbi:MAG: UbiA family prenyltransferase [Lentimicrobium sp.]|nr:UbiA family prenyltransferase [Lentimicrobium sp.]
MNNLLRLCERLFLDGFILISMAAVALGMATLAQLELPIVWDPVYLLLFSGTLVSYNLHRILKIPKNGKLQLKGRQFRFALLLLSLMLLAVSIFFIKEATLLVLFPLAVITFLYSVPLRLPFWSLPLRRVPYIKVFVVAVTWSVLTVWLPLAEVADTRTSLPTWLIFTERFFLLLAVTIPFDIRDYQRDKEMDMKTLPIALGIKTSLWISGIAALFFLAMAGFQAFKMSYFYPLISATIIFGLFIGLLLCEKCRSHRHYYVFYIDGLLLLYGILMVSGMVWK